MQLRDSALRVPAARTIDLVTTESKDEVLVYDQAVHHIHHLNASAAKVWRLCDGQRTVSEIAVGSGLTEDAVKLALRTLEDAQLLDGPLVATMRGAQSRRAFMKKAAVAGTLSIPAIISVSAPVAADTVSNCQLTYDCSANTTGDPCCVSSTQTGTCKKDTSVPGNRYYCS